MTGNELLEILSTNIKFYRKEKSWTQEKLAEEAEMSVQAVNFFEGKRRWPGEDSLSKIASALDIEVYQLFIQQDKTPVFIEETPENEKILPCPPSLPRPPGPGKHCDRTGSGGCTPR